MANAERTDRKGRYYELAPDVLERIDLLAKHLKIRKYAVLEAAIRAAEAGPDGVPVGWDLDRYRTDEPETSTTQEVLQLFRAA